MRIATYRQGFTLIEFLIVIGLWALVGLIVFSVVRDLSDAGTYIENNLENQSDLEQVFASMVIELRSAAPSALGAYPIVAAGTSSFQFFSDIDHDGVTEHVRYFLGTSTIQKGVIVATGTPLGYATSSETITTVIDNIVPTSTPLFQYFDANYTGTQNPLSYPVNIVDIRTVLISVLADVNPGAAPTPTFFARTVTMRNLRSN